MKLRHLALIPVVALIVALFPAARAAAVTLCSGSTPCVVSFTLTNAGSATAGNFNVTISGPTSGTLNIQVTTSAGSQDLSTVAGVTTSTTITMVIDVGTSFTPIMVVGAGLVSDWTWDSATHRMTVKVSPQQVSFTSGTCSIATKTCADANFDFGAMAMLAAGSSDLAQGNADLIAFMNDYSGGYVATDAQTFSMPTFDKAANSLNFDLAAPHLTKGPPPAQNDGFFNILIPSPVFTKQWGLTFDQNSPPSLSATSDGASVTLQTPVYVAARGSFPAGWLLKSNTIHYSTPKIALKPAASSVTEPTQFDVGAGTGPAVTRLPLQLPASGAFKRQVTLGGQGATVVVPEGTKVTLGGKPFTGKIEPPALVHGAAGGLQNAVSLTATGGASASGATASAAGQDVVFDKPITVTLTAQQELAQTMRVVRIAPDGSITDIQGRAVSTGIAFEATGLGTYGLASVLDLATITSAPSIDVALPVDLPADGTIAFPTTLRGAGGAVAFAAATKVTLKGAAFAGILNAPATATSPSGTASAVSVAASDRSSLAFAPAATLTLTPPEGTAASDVAPVKISGDATTCLTGTAAGTAMTTSLATTGSYGLALPLAPAAVASGRAFASESGVHARWDGQSAPVDLCPGQAATLTLRLRNTGTTTWGASSPVVIATPDGAAIAKGLIAAPLYGTRLATHTEKAVAPGETGTFAFKVRGPATSGTYRIDLRPVAEGVAWLENEGVYLPISVR